MERWKDFLDRVVKSDGTPTDDKPTEENSVVLHLDASGVSEKDSDPDEPSECYDTQEVGSQKETTQKERRVHQVQIWPQTRPSLTVIEQMMSLRVKKKNFLEGGEEGIKGSRKNLAPTKESKATEDSDDEFYDVERSDPVQELSSGDGVTVGMAGQGVPEDSDFPWKEELECLVHGGLPMALRGEVYPGLCCVLPVATAGFCASTNLCLPMSLNCSFGKLLSVSELAGWMDIIVAC